MGDIKHNFVSGKADGDDETVVRPSDWNAAHELTDLLEELTGCISVMDYGAVGNGSTDDRAAFQAALDDAYMSPRKAVYYPAGHIFEIYKNPSYNYGLHIPAHVKLLGPGYDENAAVSSSVYGGIRAHESMGTDGALVLVDGYGAGLEGVYLDGDGLAARTVDLTVAEVNIHNCGFVNGASYAFHSTSANRSRMHNSLARQSDGVGISARFDGADWIVTGSRLKSGSNPNVEWESSGGILADTHITRAGASSGHNLWINAAQTLLSNLYIDGIGNGSSGIYIYTGQVQISNLQIYLNDSRTGTIYGINNASGGGFFHAQNVYWRRAGSSQYTYVFKVTSRDTIVGATGSAAAYSSGIITGTPLSLVAVNDQP